jgi:hypothetical protein
MIKSPCFFYQQIIVKPTANLSFTVSRLRLDAVQLHLSGEVPIAGYVATVFVTHATEGDDLAVEIPLLDALYLVIDV